MILAIGVFVIAAVMMYLVIRRWAARGAACLLAFAICSLLKVESCWKPPEASRHWPWPHSRAPLSTETACSSTWPLPKTSSMQRDRMRDTSTTAAPQTMGGENRNGSA